MKIKNIKQLAVEISKREGKKKQTSIGNIREIVGIMSDLFSFELCLMLLKNKERRAKK